MRPTVRLLAWLPLLLAGCASGRQTGGDRSIHHDWTIAPDQEVVDGSAPVDLSRKDGKGTADRRPDTRSPDLKPPPDTRRPDTGPRTLFAFDFEASNGGLTGTLDWEWGLLKFVSGTNCGGYSEKPPSACHSGTHCWGTKLNDCYSPLGNNGGSGPPCNATSPNGASILTAKFTIPADYKAAKLTFWDWEDINNSYDWAEVRANNTVLWQICAASYTAPTAWVKRTLDLKAYIGQAVTLTFHFYASSVVNLAGWYIDDLSLGEV
jgi:hypothetical protein